MVYLSLTIFNKNIILLTYTFNGPRFVEITAMQWIKFGLNTMLFLAKQGDMWLIIFPGLWFIRFEKIIGFIGGSL